MDEVYQACAIACVRGDSLYKYLSCLVYLNVETVKFKCQVNLRVSTWFAPGRAASNLVFTANDNAVADLRSTFDDRVPIKRGGPAGPHEELHSDNTEPSLTLQIE